MKAFFTVLPPALVLFAAAAPVGIPSPASRPSVLDLVPDPAKEPKAPPRVAWRAQGRGVIVSHAEIANRPPGVVRSREEARTLAGAVAIAARATGADMDALIQQYSDDAESKAQGGFLGTFRQMMHPDSIARNLLQIGVGRIVGPIEGPLGFYVIERTPFEEFAYQQLLVTFGGAIPGSQVTRTRGEAAARAAELWEKIKQNPESFESLIQTHSDDPNAKERNGHTVPVARGELLPEVEDVIRKAPVSVLTGPLETPKGYIIFRRDETTRITLDSVLIQHRDSMNVEVGTVRSPQEARARADAVAAAAALPGADFVKLSQEYSDDPGDKTRKGRRTLAVSPGSANYIIAASKLQIGEVTVVESKLGFHVLRRAALELE